ncbi:MAG: hypothetical protein Q9183_002780 [Haloplaca sp. 2 TL-2023]
MDIESLLSPQDSPRNGSTPPSRPVAGKRKPKAAKPKAPGSTSPSSQSLIPPNALAQNPVSPPLQHAAQSPLMTGSISSRRLGAEAVSDSNRSARQGSTPGMDTLADLASMQHHQHATRANAGGLRSTEIYDNQASTNGSSIAGVHGSLPGRGTLDHTAADAPPPANPMRTLASKALSEADSQAVVQHMTYLSGNQYAYLSHVELINLLHRGFRSHLRQNATPRTYELLPDLRSARKAMDACFAVGEQLWIDWLEDEQLLATTFEECIAVMETCHQAVQEEPASTALWLLCANWTTSLYAAATLDSAAIDAVEPTHNINGWSEEDQTMAEEICTRQMLMDVWARGAGATRWRMDESHLLWDPYTRLRLHDLAQSPSPEGVDEMQAHFQERLLTPHTTWDQTFQMFSNFISLYKNQSYEDIMAAVNQQCAATNAIYRTREIREVAFKRAQQGGDRETLHRTVYEYIEWEVTQNRRKHAFVFELVDVLYQRALLSFPADTELWEGYVMFLTEETVLHQRRDIDLLPVVDRSTRHCPWSGSLWSQYLLAAERERIPFPNIGQIKHKATSTGLLDAGGLAEILQVYVAWCSILRRRAFQAESTDEDLDVAEVGIRSAIEDMQRLGEAKLGGGYHGDPEYRLERIYIRYLTQSGNWHTARESWKGLVSFRGDSHLFWLRYYMWEMHAWGKISYSENTTSAPRSPRPSEATKVLRAGVKRSNLDNPEALIGILQVHCEDYEDATEIQSASVQIWKARIALSKRRQKAAIEAYEAAQTQAMQEVQTLKQETSTDSAIGFATSKRKRDHEAVETESEGAAKRSRVNEVEGRADEDEGNQVESSQVKRDRENATIIVKNLPKDTTQKRVQQYFKDCGTINSLLLSDDEFSQTINATIEFASVEDSLTAQTKDKKSFDGREINIQEGSGSTVWATNFPPTADEQWIRETFGEAGEIVDIRLPSLKANTHRRFCYIQFKAADQALKAIKLDGKTLDTGHKLVAKISAPKQRTERKDAIHEGREVYVANLDWEITEAGLQEVFSKYGTVERTRIPTHVSGRSKGHAFVTFSNKEEAQAALDLHNTKLKRRIMMVEIADEKKAGPKRQAVTITRENHRTTASPSPDVAMANNDEGKAASTIPPTQDEANSIPAEIKARTIALLNVPDTVNDARIRALAESYGPLVKVALRTDHAGAIVEFKHVGDAGKAALGLDGHEIIPGRHLSVGSVGDLMKQKAEKKYDKLSSSNNSQKPIPKVTQSAVPIRRPQQLGSRGRGRGGRAVLPSISKASAKTTEKQDGAANPTEVHEAGGKSNADFKAMFASEKGNA